MTAQEALELVDLVRDAINECSYADGTIQQWKLGAEVAQKRKYAPTRLDPAQAPGT